MDKKRSPRRAPAGYRYIYRASITVNGKTIYARDYGHKAFRLKVPR